MRPITWILFALTALLLSGCAHKPQLQSPISAATTYPQKVTVMLPLHGALAGNGKATLNGFLAAYYDYLQHEPLNVTVNVVDSTTAPVTDLYKNAVANGSLFIVGPLTKTNVNNISNMGSLPVTVLALNTVDDYTTNSVKKLYQFGLSTKDEELQTAAKAWSQHPGRTIIIAPATKWGYNAVNTIQTAWKNYGGTVAASIIYRNSNSAATQIKNNFAITASQTRARNLQRLLHNKLKFTPRRRQDINAIFLIAQPSKARQIRPLLAFYFAGNIPTYSTSLIYRGFPQPAADRDLNGVIFCDMPWTLRNQQTLAPTLATLQQQIMQAWPKLYKRYNRFYALGIDSFYLMLKLNTLAANPTQGMTGATGTLYLNKYRHIYRQLDWAQMRNGVPKLLS